MPHAGPPSGGGRRRSARRRSSGFWRSCCCCGGEAAKEEEDDEEAEERVSVLAAGDEESGTLPRWRRRHRSHEIGHNGHHSPAASLARLNSTPNPRPPVRLPPRLVLAAPLPDVRTAAGKRVIDKLVLETLAVIRTLVDK